MIRLKDDVVAEFTNEMFRGLMKVEEVMTRNSSSTVLTSGREGHHKKGSKHYTGNAADLRIWYITGREDKVCSELRDALGPDFDVVLHPESHIHVEYDPK